MSGIASTKSSHLVGGRDSRGFDQRPLARAVKAALLLAGGLGAGGLALAQGAAPAIAAGAEGRALPATTVSGQRLALDEAPEVRPGGQVANGARMGILGNVSVMETPFSVTSYTAQAIANDQARTVGDLMAADPSVRAASARSNINEDLTIRGFTVPSGDFALNGMFGLTPFWRAPLETVERVEVIKGPSAALFGMTPAGSVGGVVNLVPKRAGSTPLTSITVGATSDSQLGAHLDIGRRFGPDGALGARLNVAHRGGDTPIDGQSARQSLASLGLDYRQRSLRASLDLQWQDERIDNVVRQFQAGPGLTAIPRVPDNATSYPGIGWSDGRNGSALFKAEYDLNDAVTLYAGAGHRKLNWSAIAANPALTNTAGDYSYFGGWQRMTVDSTSLEAGLRGRLATGAVTHNATLAMSSLDQEQELGFFTGIPPGMSNLYTGRPMPTPSIAGVQNPLQRYLDTKLTSVALADTLGFMQDRVLLTLGMRRQQVEGQTYDFFTGAAAGPAYDQSATTPIAGLVWKLSPQVSLYTSYVQGLSKGDSAPISAAISNPGAVLPPYKSRQKEIGIKYDQGGVLAALSLFELTKPSAGIVGNTYGVVGEQRNRGVEATLAGEAVRGLRLLGGVTYLNGELSRSADPALRGNKAVGVPKWQANLGAEWDAGFLPGLAFSGRVVHTASTYVNPANTLQIPHWTRVDAGVRYATRIAGKGVTFRLNAENLLDKDYWGTATEGYLFIGSPRTVSLSATVEL